MVEHVQSPGGVSLATLSGQIVLFDERQQLLFKLDTAQASLWNDLPPEGLSRAELTSRIVIRAGCSIDEAASYLSAIYAQWQERDLAGDPFKKARTSSESLTSKPISTCGRARDLFRIAGDVVGVTYPDPAVADSVRAVMGHLRLTEAVRPTLVVSVRRRGKAYRILSRAHALYLLPDANAVAVSLKNHFLEAFLKERSGIIALHAAALLTPRGAILLAGPSGRGKTTLAAISSALGWPLIAEDVSMLEASSGLVWGMPFALAAKPGSWPILRGYFPHIDMVQPRVRPDGRVVKYLKPGRTAGGTHGYPVAAAIFPEYIATESVSIRPLEKVDVLVRLLAEAKNAQRRLSSSGFLGVSGMLARIPTFGLQFGDAAKAAGVLEALFGQPEEG